MISFQHLRSLTKTIYLPNIAKDRKQNLKVDKFYYINVYDTIDELKEGKEPPPMNKKWKIILSKENKVMVKTEVFHLM